ncbi:hypothetical protein IM793_02465 [Pedobacter sp. MR2016-19]|uniref:hypothetical protein n=1 Tax=Pedobacter sp. MR2016-19 TaxID=2780089 RepID=UPI0018735A78|nr:hypothetical protein [Pedobacter sp. MR2016-19]MBE5318009.1 hypothetical protein [Pedobacter sp. MR2016-19]
MNKIGLFFISILFFASCRKISKYDRDRYDIQFLYNPWIQVDFNSGIVNVAVAKYRDTISISEKDKELIINSFNVNRIGDMKGNIFVDSKQSIMPPDNFQFKVIKDEKGQSDIIVTNSDPMNIADEKNKKIINFKSTVVGVLNRNIDFKAAKEAFSKFQKDSGALIF